MDQRRDALAHWATAIIRQQTGFEIPAELEMVSGDASFRRYFRLCWLDHSWIAVDAPADKEDNPRFVRIAEDWFKRGVHVPKVIAHDFVQGFMLLQDFGDQILWPVLHSEEANRTSVLHHYQQAIDELLRIQALSCTQLPPYDNALLLQEMALFPDWLCDQQLAMALTADERKLLDDAFAYLAELALAQPIVTVHRDYHSRNLMLDSDQRIAVIDFQDAVAGPATYDLVSLLRDCYVRWPAEWVDELASYYWQHARRLGIWHSDWSDFRQAFDAMGLQRHLKAAGIFARLNLRDGKNGYLASIPNTCQYLLDVSAHDPHLVQFHQWLVMRFMPALEQFELGCSES
ncbi:MAG: phosphotransferase [Thalassolituus sp.]|uniref:aminoglycoside phosphotransferase family protein n=1 Tax=Thalassolituus sp. TaxID=2030822 RepID=UPI00398279B1